MASTVKISYPERTKLRLVKSDCCLIIIRGWHFTVVFFPLQTSLYTQPLYKNETIDPIRFADGEHHPRRRKRRETAKAQCRTYTRSPKDILYLFSPPPGPRWEKSSFSVIWLQYICIFIYVCMYMCCIYVYR